ncbi:hypothetical protein [Gemmatimonas phototrophica]|nr:hypothetical protein [Gemmatimonas phototrophica]
MTVPTEQSESHTTQLERESRSDVRMLVVLLVTLGVAGALSLNAVQVARPAVDHLHQQPSPNGYTWSTALFILPCLVLGAWLYRHPKLVVQRRAVSFGLLAIVPVWCALDILLGRTFFKFPNKGSTMEWYFWGWKPGSGWAREIPIEEFIFYIGGVAAIQLTYVWCSESWLSRYRASDDDRRLLGGSKLHQPHWSSLLTGVALFGAAWAYKVLVAHSTGIPGYFGFLLLSSVLPIFIFLNVVRPLINWPAFAVTMLLLVFVSLLWEVTLGIPYGYWDYQQEQMIGIFIRPWNNLPVEEPLLWVAAAWLNVIVYEVIQLLLVTRRSLWSLVMPHRSAT